LGVIASCEEEVATGGDDDWGCAGNLYPVSGLITQDPVSEVYVLESGVEEFDPFSGEFTGGIGVDHELIDDEGLGRWGTGFGVGGLGADVVVGAWFGEAGSDEGAGGVGALGGVGAAAWFEGVGAEGAESLGVTGGDLAFSNEALVDGGAVDIGGAAVEV